MEKKINVLRLAILVLCLFCLANTASAKSELVLYGKDSTFEYYYRSYKFAGDTKIQWVLKNVTLANIKLWALEVKYPCGNGSTENITHYFSRPIKPGQKRSVSDYVCSIGNMKGLEIVKVEFDIKKETGTERVEKYKIKCPSGKLITLSAVQFKNILRIMVEDGVTLTLNLKNLKDYDETEFKRSLCVEANTPELFNKIRSKLIDMINKRHKDYCKKNPEKCTKKLKPHRGGTGIIG